MENYKLLLVVPVIVLIASVAFLGYGYATTGEWFQRSIELRGGTTISIAMSEPVDVEQVESTLSDSWSVKAQLLRSYSGYVLQIKTESGADTKQILSELASMGIHSDEPSIETFGAAISETFWAQAQFGIIAAFIMMGIIVFAIFRVPVPSFAVMLCAVSDIVVTLALMQVFGIELSLAGLASLLMLIGYSIDTDVLLTTRVLKGSDSIPERVKSAFRTGMTMSGTTLGVLVVLLVMNLSPVLNQIAEVLLIGLAVDLLFTWMQNAGLIRWHAERRS